MVLQRIGVDLKIQVLPGKENVDGAYGQKLHILFFLCLALLGFLFLVTRIPFLDVGIDPSCMVEMQT